MKKYKIKSTEFTRQVGIVDHECYILSSRGDNGEFVEILVIDLDGGLYGPYRVMKEDLVSVDQEVPS